VPVIMIVIARPAAYFRSMTIYKRHDGMVRYATTFNTVIVDHIAQSLFVHAKSADTRSISSHNLPSQGLQGAAGPD
jgi:hypothetical protein